MKEIQGKSTLVRVSMRFELSGVHCIGNVNREKGNEQDCLLP